MIENHVKSRTAYALPRIQYLMCNIIDVELETKMTKNTFQTEWRNNPCILMGSIFISRPATFQNVMTLIFFSGTINSK